jgi:hypothetical protein
MLDVELYTKKTLGKIRWVRKTVHILPKERITTAFSATRSIIVPLSEKYSKYFGITNEEYVKISNQIFKLLKGKERTTNEIKEALGSDFNISAIVNLMCDTGLVIRGRPRKGWKSNLHTYVRLDEFFPDIDLSAVDQGEAKKEVIEWYLTSYGPVTEDDIIWWTGFKKGEIRKILSDLDLKISHISILGVDSECFILSSQKPSLRSTKIPTTPVINVLPVLDPYLMGYKVRQRYLDPADYDFIFDRSGNVTSTILMNGTIVGIWDFHDPFIKIFLFDKKKKSIVTKIHHQMKAIGRFISGTDVQIKTCKSMMSLRQRTAGGFMSPLKFC